MRSESFHGRGVVVTGAGRGFGEQIALQLAELGASVGVLDLDGAAAERCAERLGPGSLAVRCDVADFDAVQQAFAQIQDELGDVDVLVNNAGIVSSTPFLETSEEEWDRVLAIDYTGMYNCCKAVVPGMLARGGGRIVNVSSVAGKRGGGFLGTAAYATAKAAVIGLTKALARELAPAGITVNAVAPGAIDTEMTKILREDRELLARVLGAVPLGRRGEIREVADAVVFLASDLASYLTGETLDVDGGVTME